LQEELGIEDVVYGLRSIAQENLPDSISFVFKGEAEAYEETAREITITYV